MVGKLRKKKPLDTQDVNAHSSRRRMRQKENALLDSLNNEDIATKNVVADKSLESGDSGLTGVINQHLEEKTPLVNRITGHSSYSESGIPLTKEALSTLQDTLHDLEVRLSVKQTLTFLKEVNYSETDYTQRRNNFLFELDCFPDVTWLEKGNLRTFGYMSNVYQMVDRNWYVNRGISQEDFTNMPSTLKLLNVMTPLVGATNDITSEDVYAQKAKVTVQDIAPKHNLIGSRLCFRASSTVFDETVDADSFLRQDISDDELSLPDSLDHCNSVRKKKSKRKLNRRCTFYFKGR